jgi:tRNA dimethylallyltransferase
VSSEYKLITILGPTAVGKTKFASNLAKRFNGEIISADSRQVYRKMDIGTGKDYDDYIVDGERIKAHLIDVVSPSEEFSLYSFRKLFAESFHEIIRRKKQPFLVGGTGLYLSSVIENYELNDADFSSPRSKELEKLGIDPLREILQSLNPDQHNTTDFIEKDRIIKAIIVAESSKYSIEDLGNIEHLIFGLYEDREIVRARIRKRLKSRLENGMIEEAERLINSGISHEKLRFFGLEYKFLSMYLNGELNYNDMHQKLGSAIIQFSKRQMTWFRKMEKKGIKIHWLKNREFEYAEAQIKSFLFENEPA